MVISPNVSDFTLLKILKHSRCHAIFIDAVLPQGCSLLKRNCLICRMLSFLTATQKGFAALCHLTSCWTEVDAAISANWINWWKQSSQMI